MELSIIVPLYNEEESIRPLHKAITEAMEPLHISYEILFVDDGSSDATFKVAEELAQGDAHMRVIRFRRNHGQTPAMAAGIDHARGNILVTMDGDLQNDPTDIAQFIEKINEGYDIVVGWRFKRQDTLVTRKIPSVIANWIIGKVTGVPIKDNGCSLKAYRADVIKKVPLYSEMHRFIPAMTSLIGARVAEIKVKHHARKFGVSKYGLSRIYKVILDLLTIKTIVSFSSMPLVWFGLLAIPLVLIGSALLLDGGYNMLTGSGPGIVPAGIGVLCHATAGFLVLCGALAELVFRTSGVRGYRPYQVASIVMEGDDHADWSQAVVRNARTI